ncbi:MAG: STM4015 family protein [Acidobacteriota bacterium]
MERRNLEYADSKSSKFWNIELEGTSHTVVYGRIGTDGQTKTKDFGSAEKAKTSFDKLVAQKLGKGYVDAVDPAAAASDGGALSSIHFPCCVKEDDLYENIRTFAGKRVVDYKAAKPPGAGVDAVFRFRGDWEDQNFDADLDHFLASDHAARATAIVIGCWSPEDMYDTPAETIIGKLAGSSGKLPNLAAIYLGDITRDECEMSWIKQSDLSPLLAAFPELQLLRTRGMEGLELEKPVHQRLRALAIETGGMPVQVVRAVCQSDFPELEYLELWLGTDHYGGDSTVEDLQPILSGKLFPKLKYLGLRNCDHADAIAGVIVNAPILERIETLDLSLGTLSDEGGRALLNLPTDGSLQRVNLHHHFMNADMAKKLAALDLIVDVSNPQEQEDDDGDAWRFVAVGE